MSLLRNMKVIFELSLLPLLIKSTALAKKNMNVHRNIMSTDLSFHSGTLHVKCCVKEYFTNNTESAEEKYYLVKKI